MEKMRMESINMTEQNIKKIGEMFPSVITETKDGNGKLKKAINFKLLKQMLDDDIVDGDEAYEFTWVGKKSSVIEAGRPIKKTLRPCKDESKEWDNTQNLYIEGDNLDELAACLLRWMPPLVPWMLDLQNEVKEQADEYGSEGKALLAIVKANPDKYKIDYQSKDSPFL